MKMTSYNKWMQGKNVLIKYGSFIYKKKVARINIKRKGKVNKKLIDVSREKDESVKDTEN